jgi:phosphopantetheinyl transferase
MSPTWGTSRPNIEVFKNRRDEQSRTANERRSLARPTFAEGWRKAVGKNFAISPRHAASSRIDIWIASAQGLLRADSCLQILTEKDWASLGRIRDLAARSSSVAARVLLRLGLSHATERKIAPQEWDFSVTDRQRPLVAAGLPQVHFSVSHTEQLAVVAISPTIDVGIDIESVDQDVTHEVMAEFCHHDERRAVKDLPDLQKHREFIRLWTLKEAYTKMTGAGHSLDFRTIKLLLDPTDLTSIDDRAPDTRTQFESFYVSLDHGLFHASLAMEGSIKANGSTEVQIINLVEPAGAQAALIAPSCSQQAR